MAMSASVDPKLKTAIRNGKARGADVHAAFTLKGSKGEIISPENTDRIVREIVRRAADGGKAATKLVVFKNLQSFAIEGSADLVERIAKEDAIGTAALGS